jgi:hypothetical protein
MAAKLKIEKRGDEILIVHTIFEGGHPRTIPPKFGSNWPCGFRGVD